MVLRWIAIAIVLWAAAVALFFRILPALARAVYDHLPVELRTPRRPR